MQASTSDFISLSAFARVVAEHLRDSLGTSATEKRVFNLDEAAEYCGLTRDSFKKWSATGFAEFDRTSAGASTKQTWIPGLTVIKSKLAQETAA